MSRPGETYTKAQREQFARNDAARELARRATLTIAQAAEEAEYALIEEADGYGVFLADGTVAYLRGEALGRWWIRAA